MGKGNERFGAWSFSAVWRFPEDTVGQQSQDLSLMDSALGCFVLELESCPQYLSYFEFKYSLSDWEVARTERPIRVPVSGYLQIDRNRAIDSDNLKNWFIADWRPVHRGLRRNETYSAWAQTDAAFRHVQVCGKPSVDCHCEHGVGKKAVSFPTGGMSFDHAESFLCPDLSVPN